MGATPTQDVLAARFETDRTRLRGVAYRMLGSFAEAEERFRRRGCGSRAPTPPRSRTSAAG